jgi:hypothetical protein
VNTWKVILATMVIFGTGVVTGMVGGGLLVRYAGIPFPQVRRPALMRAQMPPNSAGGMRLDFLRRVQNELDLTPEQRVRIDQIFKDSQDRTKQIMEPVSPLLRDELKRARAEFVDVLTPKQRARFNELAKEQQQRSREQRQAPPQSLRTQAVDSLPAPQPTNP